MARDDKLRQWWTGLSDTQRADAAAYTRTGELSEDLKRSLQRAGLIQPGQQPSRRLESQVGEFIRLRHDT